MNRAGRPGGGHNNNAFIRLLAEFRPEWADQAECRGADVEIFFPERGEETGTAKQICKQCPVAAECLDYALRTKQYYGIWGGTSGRERERMRRRMRMAS